MVFAIIVAAGKSDRMGANVDKAFLSLGTQPVLVYALQAFEKCPEIEGVVLVVRKDRLEPARGMVQLFGCSKVVKVVVGGNSRQASVLNGMAALNDEVRVVVIHDGARPCVTPALISETVKAAKRYGSGIAAAKVTDTVKEVKHGMIVDKTVDRSMLWAVQTPQTFKRELLEKGYEVVRKKRLTVTDDAAAVELVCKDVRLVPSTWSNMKITVPEDLALAAALLRV